LLIKMYFYKQKKTNKLTKENYF